MIHIDLAMLEFPDGWRQKAQDAKQKIADIDDAGERKTFLEKNSKIWASLKQELGQLSHNKCWYCECRNTGSDDEVDHFRPKGEVFEDEDHPGYWWLAFDPINYRYSCTFCNQRRVEEDSAGGKTTHFPLVNPDGRVYSQEIDFECDRENPILLDPTDPRDHTLLSFDMNGNAIPRAIEEDNETDFNRASVSIDHYHLNRAIKCESRKVLFNTLKRKIDECALNMLKLQRNDNDGSAKRASKQLMGELLRCSKSDAEFSAAARATLITFEEKYSWLKDISGRYEYN